MSYREKPILKLYKYENNSFVMQAQIDDYQECSFEDNLYEAGQFSISINFNIPNSQLFQRGLFIQFGNSWKFGEITKIQDQIGEDGKGSQFRIITGFDARYILKRRVIKNMNSNGLWVMTGKGEIVLRNLINDQCGTNAENKRKLPITNTIPTSESAIGKEYSASEQFSNLYEVCKTIATQSEMGWRLEFNGTSLNLVCFEGTDRTQTVQFSTSFDSLANGEFIDSSESFSNAIYVGGKGQNDDRDIYEGESAIEGNSPAGLDRFESWDNQSSMTTESEYETEALSMLNQYGQTLTMSGNGLAKCPYEYEKEYFVGDKIKIAFSGKSANAQILSVTEHWSFGAYEINFSFGKPLPGLDAQLQLILKQIQKASNKSNSTDSVRWYTIPTDSVMPSADVTYNTIGFVGDVGNGATFKLYLDNEKTGAKTYHVWFKQLAGSGKLTLTTGKSGAVDLSFGGGTYVAIISVDENGNIVDVASTPTNTIAVGNSQPATSDSVANTLYDSQYAGQNRNLNSAGWYKIAELGTRNRGQSIVVELTRGFSNTASEAHHIIIEYGGKTVRVCEFAMASVRRFTKIKLCYNENNTDKMGLYVYYSDNISNPCYVSIRGLCASAVIPRSVELYNFETDTKTWDTELEFNLGADGFYINGENRLPSAPTTSGTYNLRCSVSDGVSSYNWDRLRFPISSLVYVSEKTYDAVTEETTVIEAGQYNYGILPYVPSANIPSGYHVEYICTWLGSTSGNNKIQVWINNIQCGEKSSYTPNEKFLSASSTAFKRDDIVLEPVLSYSNNGINIKIKLIPGSSSSSNGRAFLRSLTITAFLIADSITSSRSIEVPTEENER